MKSQERHQLKQDEFVVRATHVAAQFAENRRRWMMGIGAVVVIGAVVGGYLYFQSRAKDAASALLGAALQIEQAPIVPAPTVPGAVQQAGTYPTEAARGEAAIAAYQTVIDTYPSAETGTAGRYHLGTVYLRLGRAADAERAFAEAVERGGTSVYAEMAKMGQVEALTAQSKYDEAIRILTDLSGLRDGTVPVDGVLMELARVCRKAGKTEEARAAFKRVVDEFPESPYATDARQQLATMG
jgi:TolA-binding protein